MKNLALALQALAALAVLAAAVPLTLNQWALREARQATRTRAALHGSLAAEAAAAQDPALAAQAFSDALALDPGNPTYQAGMLNAHVEAILNDAAVISADPLRLNAELADAVTRTDAPSARLLVAFGRVLQFRGHGEQARARFAQAVKTDPNFADAHLYLGDAALKDNKIDEASVALGRALELDPKLMLAKFALGQVRALQKRPDEALKLLREAAEAIPNGKVWLALGRVLAEKEAWPEAERALERALALDKSLVGAHGLLADAYLKANRIEAAIGALRMAYERAGDVEAYRKLGRLLARTRQPAEALTVFGEIRSLFPDDVEAHCQIGTSAIGTGQLDVAKAALEKCVELGAKDPAAGKMLETARAELGKVNAAIEQYQAQAAKEQPKKLK